MNSYKQRDALLLTMGFRSYSEYLASPVWASIRIAVLSRDDRKCRGCGRQAWQVHHRSYSLATMQGTDISKLESICGKCHKSIEFKNKAKLSNRKANTKLGKKVRRLAKSRAYGASPEYRRLMSRKRELQAMPFAQTKTELGSVSKQIREIISQFSRRKPDPSPAHIVRDGRNSVRGAIRESATEAISVLHEPSQPIPAQTTR